MTTPDPATVAAIADGLTEAQRRFLLRAEPTLASVPKTPCASWWDRPKLYVTVEGRDCWFAVKGMTSPEGCSTFTTGFESLTPLGLAVRRHLERQSHD